MNIPTHDTNIAEQIENSFKDIELQNKLMNYAFSLTGSEDDAKDIVQQAIHNVWRKKDALQNWRYPQAYLMKTIKNQFINNYRKKQKRPTTHIAEDRQRDKTIQDTASNKAESDFSVQTIQEEINNLSETLRTPLELRTEKYAYKEIAQTLNVSLGTVKSRIFMARRELKSTLIQKDKWYQPFIRERSSPKPSQPWQDSLQ